MLRAAPSRAFDFAPAKHMAQRRCKSRRRRICLQNDRSVAFVDDGKFPITSTAVFPDHDGRRSGAQEEICVHRNIRYDELVQYLFSWERLSSAPVSFARLGTGAGTAGLTEHSQTAEISGREHKRTSCSATPLAQQVTIRRIRRKNPDGWTTSCCTHAACLGDTVIASIIRYWQSTITRKLEVCCARPVRYRDASAGLPSSRSVIVQSGQFSLHLPISCTAIWKPTVSICAGRRRQRLSCLKAWGSPIPRHSSTALPTPVRSTPPSTTTGSTSPPTSPSSSCMRSSWSSTRRSGSTPAAATSSRPPCPWASSLSSSATWRASRRTTTSGTRRRT
nr:hypothetical protein CFP56_11775 [Quercus suber]